MPKKLIDRQFELKLVSGKTVIWEGKTGTEAAKRYVDMHRGDKVVAWRDYPRHGLFVGIEKIIE